MAVGQQAVVEVQREVADARVADTQRVRALRRNRGQLTPGAEDEVEDDVVRCEVPEDVDFLLDEPEVHPDRVKAARAWSIGPVRPRRANTQVRRAT
jgi:hypothetical protein